MCLSFGFSLVSAGEGEVETVPEMPEDLETVRWSLSGYIGQVSYTRFNEIIRFDTDFRSSYVAVLGATRVLYDHDHYARWEWEGQVAQHWGKQDHAEINSALLLRWRRFPWDDILNTSVALGAGPSFALEVPAIEQERHDRASRRLFYMPFEIAAAFPGRESGEVFVRIHHRSGVFDVVSRAGGSNFVGLGYRWSF